MKAILLAAGFGSRLMPITKNTPKCMVKIGDKPLIDIWIEKLFQAGISRILINTHYLSEVVKEHLKQNIFFKKGKIIIKYEKKLLGTAGTLINNLNFFDDDGILLHADNFTTDNLQEFIKFHKKNINDSYFSMMSFKTDNPKNSGIIEVDENNLLINFYEKDDRDFGNKANCAIYILTNKMIKSLKKTKFKDFSTEIIPRYLNKIKVYETNNFFIDVGDVKSLDKARNIFLKNNAK